MIGTSGLSVTKASASDECPTVGRVFAIGIAWATADVAHDVAKHASVGPWQVAGGKMEGVKKSTMTVPGLAFPHRKVRGILATNSGRESTEEINERMRVHTTRLVLGAIGTDDEAAARDKVAAAASFAQLRGELAVVKAAHQMDTKRAA